MVEEFIGIFDVILSIIPDWILRIFLWGLGKIYYYGFNKTCGDIEDSNYNGKPCVLSPGHYSVCKSNWEYNSTLKKEIRFEWVYNFNAIYSRASIKH